MIVRYCCWPQVRKINPAFAESVARARGTGAGRPDLSLALAMTPDGGWEALCPEAPLRRWRMIELHGSGPLMRRELGVDERILHYLMGVNYLDSMLEGIVSVVTEKAILSGRQRALADHLADIWSSANTGGWPVLLIAGRDALTKRIVMADVCRSAQLRLYRINAADIPSAWTERQGLAIYGDRELALSDGALLIECEHDGPGGDAAADAAAVRLANVLNGPVAIASPDPGTSSRTPRFADRGPRS